MNEIKIFENTEFGSVRTIEENGKVMFCGSDVAKALGYKEPHKAISRHCKGGMKRPTPTNGGLQEMIFISEGDIYRLAAKSELPGADKFESWIFDEVLPSIRRTGGYQIPQSRPDKSHSLEVKEMNARVRMSNQYLKLAAVDTVSPQYKNILVAKSAEILAGEPLLPLPKSEQKMYSATEIGDMFGVTAQKVGRIANLNGLKTEEYGEFYRDKSPYSSKEVDAFRYNDKAVEKFKRILT